MNHPITNVNISIGNGRELLELGVGPTEIKAWNKHKISNC